MEFDTEELILVSVNLGQSLSIYLSAYIWLYWVFLATLAYLGLSLSMQKYQNYTSFINGQLVNTRKDCSKDIWADLSAVKSII